ncbi:Putative N2,N2-dimethylguanosine tRNA methyltransferase [Ceraceosorus bombacis]|uniref:Putative N2,N2-dimethylguanosine tRNA methyltransferase n=1 Tax=Ceraceosorus bombacis TaxID=401625 RepID=A0A0P1BSL8_9BASI|nr:Putative N2,N2-dimethylguanosine tRNA methyltransferase [Ceraceosorus bombacis]
MSDPNFPLTGLRIHPSAPGRRWGRASAGAQKPLRAVAAAAGAGCDLESKSAAKAEDVHNSEKPGQDWQMDSATDIREFGIAGRIWEAAYLMQLYLRPQQPDRIEFDPPCHLFANDDPREALRNTARSSNIVELGSGAGYVGLHLAIQLEGHHAASRQRHIASDGHASSSTLPHSPAQLFLTDLDNVCPLLRRNAGLAGFGSSWQRKEHETAAAVDLDRKIRRSVELRVRPLPWGSSPAVQALKDEINDMHDEAKLTHIVCSDLVYFPELLPSLLRTLVWLTDLAPPSGLGDSAKLDSGGQATSPLVLISYKVRSLIKEQPFWTAFGTWFDFEPVRFRFRKRSNTGLHNNDASPTKAIAEHGTPSSSASPDPWTEWDRFGRRRSHLELDESISAAACHLHDTHITTTQGLAPAFAISQSDGSTQEAQDEEDSMYIFVARRKVTTLGCLPIDDDAMFMDGWRGQRSASCSAQVVEDLPRISQFTEGADQFEWLLMSEASCE